MCPQISNLVLQNAQSGQHNNYTAVFFNVFNVSAQRRRRGISWPSCSIQQNHCLCVYSNATKSLGLLVQYASQQQQYSAACLWPWWCSLHTQWKMLWVLVTCSKRTKKWQWQQFAWQRCWWWGERSRHIFQCHSLQRKALFFLFWHLLLLTATPDAKMPQRYFQSSGMIYWVHFLWKKDPFDFFKRAFWGAKGTLQQPNVSQGNCSL